MPDGPRERGGQHAGVVGVRGQVGGACRIALEQDLRPVLASVLRAEDAPLVVGAEGVAQRRDVDQVRVCGMNAYAGDVAGVLQAHAGPGLAPIGGPVNTVTVGYVAPDARLAHTGVDDVMVRWRNRDCAHGRRLEESV